VPQGGTKITTLFQAVEKAGGFFDSLKEREATGLPLFSCLPKKSVIPSRRSRRRGNPFFFASGGLFSFSSERKEEKKRRQKLRFWISLRAFTCCSSCLLLTRERHAVQISPKYCIVSASWSAVAFTLKYKRTNFYRG